MPRIRVIDFETTGTEADAEVCEVGWCDIALTDGAWVVAGQGSYLCGVQSMPPEVRAVHHLSLADVAGQPRFDPASLWEHAKAAGVDVVSAHNLAFEAQFWGESPVPLICTYKAALRAWPEAPAHSNGVLRYWLEEAGRIAPIHDLTMPPHRAGPDAYVTAHILIALLGTESANDMARWTKEPCVFPTCPIGKEWRGKRWAEVDRGFLEWMLRQTDMDPDLKWNARRELERRSFAQ